MRYRLQRHDGTDCSATMVPITVLRMVPIQRYRHMFNRKYVLNRIDNARKQQIPMTNYGVAIAHLNGILDKIAY